ncbi:ribosomal RNA-processing protein 8 [Triplophysa rosa]|uniref:Ribosomal RNA-processing protein 8 n=1 Tax=Triplophysa rosa TaxID=992332 RepID=A0A9W7WIW8_TRIRA|nr:ribosomal RNA-processing protein 8 [Triplophysa rosa]KAI7800700.1 putative ribosomal RNA-processing protein 8 [Triplophysa rosa]
MFAEEEWADSPSANGSHLAVVNVVSSVPAKDKVVGKRSLLRTLQTLGSVPEWETGKPFGESDDEEDSSSNKRKKKKCKKRKRTSNADKKGERNGQPDPSETPVKKKKPMKKTKKEQSPKVSQESIKDAESVEKQGSQTEQRLSRKQWKTKMKNKKRCKNKFLQNTTDVDNAKAKEEPVSRSKDIPATQKVQKASKASKKRKKSHVKNGIAVKDDTDNCKDSVKSSINTDNLQSETQPAGDCISSHEISHEVVDKMRKKSQIQAENLPKTLKHHLTDERNRDTDEKGKNNHKTVNSKGDTEQAPLDRSAALRLKMEKRLEAARFRYINELLYTSTSGEAKRMFQQDPDAIGIYHKGYTAQVQHWPENPVDSIISYISQRPASLVVADFGCGDCKIARSVKNKVHSFDLAPVCELATSCDMSKVPLRDSSVDIAVFCLSLMGTNLGDFLKEANRVLVMGGVLKIAEVASRFADERSFVGAMSHLGFKLSNKDAENSHFYSFEFIKTGKAPGNAKRPGLQLKPCLYKKR